MNKKTKGLIAGVVGAGLLLGASGTFALWFDTTALGTDGDSIATGLLSLDDVNFQGEWRWAEFSSTAHELEAGDAFNPNGELVPGDVIEWEWTEDELSVILSGDTILANIYLDGIVVEDIAATVAALAPLTVTFGDGISLDVNDAGAFVIASGLTATNHADEIAAQFTAPTITVTFPQEGRVNEGTPGLGYMPDADDYDNIGYGRDMQIGADEVFDFTRLSVRLQQTPRS